MTDVRHTPSLPDTPVRADQHWGCLAAERERNAANQRAEPGVIHARSVSSSPEHRHALAAVRPSWRAAVGSAGITYPPRP